MFYDKNILNKPILIENDNNDFKYKIEYLNDNKIIECIFTKNKKKRRSCLVLINIAKKNKYLANKTKERLFKYGFILDNEYNIILDMFKKENQKIKDIVKKYQSKPNIRNKIKIYHKLYYYKSKNIPIPNKYLEHCKLFKSFN